MTSSWGINILRYWPVGSWWFPFTNQRRMRGLVKLIYLCSVYLCCFSKHAFSSLLWRHNGRGSVSILQPHHCLLNHLFMRRSKKTSNLRVTGLCEGNSPVTGECPHKGPVTLKMFPSDDVIDFCSVHLCCFSKHIFSSSYRWVTTPSNSSSWWTSDCTFIVVSFITYSNIKTVFTGTTISILNTQRSYITGHSSIIKSKNCYPAW